MLRKSKGVQFLAHPKFFDILEKERKKEQEKIRKKIGVEHFNLTQTKFTEILANKKVQFKSQLQDNKFLPNEIKKNQKKRRRN